VWLISMQFLAVMIYFLWRRRARDCLCRVTQPGPDDAQQKRDDSKRNEFLPFSWRMASPDAPFEHGDKSQDCDFHWCAPPSEETWRIWAGSSDGLASQQPVQRGNQWHVWCFCGQEMTLSTAEDYFENLECHCGRVGERVRRAGTFWLCAACGSTHSVCDRLTGQPQGIPASPQCRSLRYQGHALIRCLGNRRAYGAILPADFHFGSAGVASSIDVVMRLRQAVARQQDLDRLRLTDSDVNLEAFRKVVTDLTSEQVDRLLFAYVAAGRIRLLEVLLCARVCNVNAQRQKDGCTALHLARYRHQEDIADLLLAHGADSAIQNKWGETPEDSAKCISN